jgi:hypothetical protein
MNDQISLLEAELANLKRERKEQARAAKIQNSWLSAIKHPPSPENLRVLAWTNGQMEFCWFNNGKWYVYDGTWFFTEQERIVNVTHWMAKDWLYTKDWPLYGPGFKNWFAYYWRKLTQDAADIANDLRPRGWGKNAQLDKKVVYFRNERTGEIRMGLPESFPASPGFDKVVCTTAHEAEVWSERLRQYNTGRERKIDEQREAVEGEYRKEHRSQINHLMANSSSKYGKEFLRRHLERMDRAEARGRMTREEYLHSEGYERGR